MSIRWPLLTIALLAMTLPALAQVQQIPYAPKGWKLPAAEAQKWAERMKQFVPPSGWTVSAKGNDVLIEREKPVGFSQLGSSANATDKPFITQGVYRLTLHFGPKMSLDEHEKLTAQNRLIYAKEAVILRKYNLTRRSEGEPIPYGPTEEVEARKKSYYAEAKKLALYDVPEFYTPDYSLTLYQSWRWFEYLNSGTKAVDMECQEVRENVASFFGTYDGLVARGGSFGHEEPVAAKQ